MSAASRLSEAEFVVRAIERLREPPYKGIHAVYSGFNQAFTEYFGTDPVAAVAELERQDLVITRPVRGGVIIYKLEEAPRSVIRFREMQRKAAAITRPKTTLDRIIE